MSTTQVENDGNKIGQLTHYSDLKETKMLTLLPKAVQTKYFRKFKTAIAGYSVAWGKLIHKKTDVKNLVAMSLKTADNCLEFRSGDS